MVIALLSWVDESADAGQEEEPVVRGVGEHQGVQGQHKAHRVEYLLPAQGVGEVAPEQGRNYPGDGSDGGDEADVDVAAPKL